MLEGNGRWISVQNFKSRFQQHKNIKFQDVIKYLIFIYHSIRKKPYNISTISKFQKVFFLNFQKIKTWKNLLTPICAGESIKEWVCSVTREKDGDTRIWVPGLTLSSFIARKWWNCILIDYVPSHQGRAAIHRPECSFRSVECVLMHNTSKTPCLAMNERARKRSVSSFLVWLQCQDSAVSETTKLQTHVRMCSHPTSDSCKSLTIGSPATHQILAQLATRILRHGDGGARAHVQRCPNPPLTCGKHVLSDAQPTYQIWTQSAKPFLRYRSAVCTCARAEILHPWLVVST